MTWVFITAILSSGESSSNFLAGVVAGALSSAGTTEASAGDDAAGVAAASWAGGVSAGGAPPPHAARTTAPTSQLALRSPTSFERFFICLFLFSARARPTLPGWTLIYTTHTD